MKIKFLAGLFSSLLIVSCGNNGGSGTEAENEGFTPVTVTHPVIGDLSETINLNATSKFLVKTSVKSDLNGYVQEVLVRPGQRIKKGEELFIIKSKESEHLGNTISKLDTAFHFSATVSVKSPSDGYITELAYKAGDYVQDNEILASVSDISSLVFLLDIPYELKKNIPANRNPELVLPDGTLLKGTLESSLPAVDPASQTISYVIHVSNASLIPENLIATVKFFRNSKRDAVILPKGSLLTDETQTEFWIMKMTDSATAVKVPVEIGLTTSENVEIVSPPLLPGDKILLTGNYGLPDTARVVVENKK